MKLLEAALAKIALCHGCGSKIPLEQDLGQRKSTGHIEKLHRGSIKHTSVNLNSKEKKGQL